MDNPIILKYKKERVIKTIYLTCEYCHLSVPTINFDGCPLEGKNGPEWGHYHTEGVNKICVSERQLMQQTSADLENTAIHEVIHHLGLMHGSPEEKAKFEKIKNYTKSKIWRPEGGVQFISAEQSKEADERLNADPDRVAAINEDSDYIKFIEGRPTGNKIKDPEKTNELIAKRTPSQTKKDTRIKLKKETKITYKSMSKAEIEDSRRRLGITQSIIRERPVPKLDEKEQEKLTNKVYGNMDTGFGDEHGENRWNIKGKSIIAVFLTWVDKRINWNKYYCAWCKKPFDNKRILLKCTHCGKNFCEEDIRIPNHRYKNLPPPGGGLREIHHANGKIDVYGT